MIRTNFSHSKRALQIVPWAAAILWMAFPVLAGAQLEQPTTDIPLPTSSVNQPVTSPVPDPDVPPQMLSAVPYPYRDDSWISPGLKRLLLLSATVFAAAGILFISGTAARTVDGGRMPVFRRR